LAVRKKSAASFVSGWQRLSFESNIQFRQGPQLISEKYKASHVGRSYNVQRRLVSGLTAGAVK
jgi:hypothetical protein